MNNSPDGLLPITPAPHPRERLLGYVLRVAESNGYLSPSLVLAAAGIGPQQLLTTTLPAAAIARVLGRSTDSLNHLFWQSPTKNNADRVPGIAYTRVLRQLELRWPRVCPQCVIAEGYLEAAWDLRLMVACPLHLTMLVNRCEACGAQLTWRRPGVLRCNCGQVIKASGIEIPARAGAFLCLLRRILYRDLTPLDSAFGFPENSLRAIQFDSLIGLLSTTCNLLGKYGRAPGLRKGEIVSIGLVDELAAVFEQWPKGLHRFLYESVRPAKRNSTSMACLSRRYEDIYRGFLGFDDQERQGNTEFIRRALVEYATSAGSRIKVGEKLLRETGLKWKDVKYGGITAVARTLDVRIVSAKAWQASGRLQKLGILPCTECAGMYTFPNFIPPKKGEGALEIRRAARHLGIGAGLLKQLREDGVYETTVRGGHFSQFHLVDLESLRYRILERAGEVVDSVPEGYCALRSFRGFERLPVTLKSRVIRAIINGYLRLTGRVGSRILDVVVEKSALDEVIKEGSRDLGLSVTGRFAQRSIGCSSGAVNLLIREGHLRYEAKPGGGGINAASLDDFVRTYVNCSVVAAGLGIRPATLVHRYRKHGVKVLTFRGAGRRTNLAFFPRSSEIVQQDLLLEPFRAERSASGIPSAMNSSWDTILAVRRYLAALKRSDKRLPRLNGKIVLQAVGKACGVDRNTLGTSRVIVDILAEHNEYEKEVYGDDIAHSAEQKLKRYLEHVRTGRKTLPVVKGRLNILRISKEAGFSRSYLDRHEPAFQILKAFIEDQQLIMAPRHESKRRLNADDVS